MKIRTVFQPDVELEVDEAEAETLRLQGLLHVAPTPSAASAPPAVGKPSADTKTSPSGAQAAAAKSETPTGEGADQAPTTQKG